jgi:hypothetical protein
VGVLFLLAMVAITKRAALEMHYSELFKVGENDTVGTGMEHEFCRMQNVVLGSVICDLYVFLLLSFMSFLSSVPPFCFAACGVSDFLTLCSNLFFCTFLRAGANPSLRALFLAALLYYVALETIIADQEPQI